MKTPVDEITSVLDRLSHKVAELENRIAALENATASVGHFSIHAGSAPPVTPAPLANLSLPQTAGALAAVGRVFLGIAGAYLLRALAESALLPQPAVVAIALTYAVAWLVWAEQARAATDFARVAAALTAALILSPMLWELTLRFRTLTPWMAAATLCGFMMLAVALGWKRNLAPVVGVAVLAAAITALPLLVATRDPPPFLLALLVIALAVEAAACCNRWLGLRWIAAAAADFGILAVILIYASAAGTPAEYKPVPATLLMTIMATGFAIYGASTVIRSVVLLRRTSIFEIAQTSAAFSLAALGILRLRQSAAPVLGAFCLLAAAACYLPAFTRLMRLRQSRNHHVFATWGGALFLMGSFLLLPQRLQATWLAGAAVMAVAIGIRWAHLAISFHGVAFLTAAALVSGLFEYVGTALAGSSSPATPGWELGVTAAAILSYAIATRSLPDEDPWYHRLLRLALATPAATAIAALVMILAIPVARLMTPMTPQLLAATHALVMCLAALALAFVGSRWKRIELIWLAYAFIAICTVKLLFEDLRVGSAGTIAASLFFYGMAWVLVPRLARRTARDLTPLRPPGQSTSNSA